RWLSPAPLRELLEHPADALEIGRPVAGLCGCEAFSSPDGSERARGALLVWLAEQVELPPPAMRAIKVMLGDFTQNVLRHADIGGGVAAVAADEGQRTLEFAVADRGI